MEDGQAELGRRLVQVGNFFQIISRVILHFMHFFLVDLPYVSVTLIFLNIFFVMTSQSGLFSRKCEQISYPYHIANIERSFQERMMHDWEWRRGEEKTQGEFGRERGGAVLI